MHVEWLSCWCSHGISLIGIHSAASWLRLLFGGALVQKPLYSAKLLHHDIDFCLQPKETSFQLLYAGVMVVDSEMKGQLFRIKRKSVCTYSQH